ncbi:MAG: T9SS type A sorting domain-containing protein [Bacteroidetes bacterium]|nr:T9SS type A sorting domain-containing protein [Bacteroidota bacterium]
MSSFAIGNHYIHFQFRDELGQWSSVLTDSFYRDTITTSILLNTGQNSINLYPNPTNGKFIVELLNEVKSGTIIVYNSLGEEIYAEEISEETGVKAKEINLNARPGVYFAVFVNKEKRFIHRFVIE